MRIAIDARMYGNAECTGIGTYIEKMTNELFRLDKKNEYILFLRGQAFDTFVPPHAGVTKARLTPRWYSYGEQFKLPFELAREKFDLIHYPHFNSPIFYYKKSVCTIHDITPLSFPGHKMKSWFRRAAYGAVFGATLRKASRIIAVSESTKQGILDNFSLAPAKIKVIYEGVDERFREEPNYDIISSTIEKYGITKPYLFFVGVWRSHKNVEGLVKCFNLLKKKYSLPHQLVLGGREDLHFTKVREEINNSPYRGEIITPGFIKNEDLPLLYQGAETFVIPSFIEGFGLIAIEAQACGCPVAASNLTSLPEVLANSAEYFDPADPESMAEAIWKIVGSSDNRNKLIVAGRENVARFSWKKCAKETLDTYTNIF